MKPKQTLSDNGKRQRPLAPATCYASWYHWTDAQLTTLEMTIRQAANKAGMACKLGFENVWLNGEPIKYGQAREIIGSKLLLLGYKPIRKSNEA
jgi:hypothetical protein